MTNLRTFSKKSIPFISVLFFLSSFADAQPVLNAEQLTPFPGQSLSIGGSETVVPPGPSGADQVWDFSALSSTFPSQVSFQPVTDQPGAMDFPGSTHVLSDENYTINQYFTFTDDSASLDGNSAFILGDTIVDRAPDPVRLFQFPLSFGLSYTDIYTFENSGNISTLGDLVHTVDGYGTLILPSTTLVDVLRIKREGEITNYLYDEEGNLINTVVSPVVLYDYVSAGYPYPVINMNIIEEDTSISYLTGLVTSVYERGSASDLSIYPNPVCHGNLTIEAKEPLVSVEAFEMNGKRIPLNQDLIKISGTTASVDCENLRPGYLILTIESRKGRYSERVMICE